MTHPTRTLHATRNDRFKRFSSRLTCGAIVAATAFHFALFRFFPRLEAASLVAPGGEITVTALPPEVKIPPPPPEVPRPATPRAADVPISEDITIQRTDWEANPVESLPPPSATRPPGPSIWIPRDVEPVLRNEREILRLLRSRYPSMLREAGIGGTVVLRVFVDESGTPGEIRVQISSGYPALDQAAAAIGRRMEFVPARNRDRPVGVWSRIPVVFRVD